MTQPEGMRGHKRRNSSSQRWLNAEIIYPIYDSQWVSPVHVVPKKAGVTVMTNEKGEEIQTRLPTKWRVCIDYRKLNSATKKDHFPLLFIDQILDQLPGSSYFCFLNRSRQDRGHPKPPSTRYRKRFEALSRARWLLSKIHPGLCECLKATHHPSFERQRLHHR